MGSQFLMFARFIQEILWIFVFAISTRMGQSNLLTRTKHLFGELIYCYDETYSLDRTNIISSLVWLFIASPSKNWCEELILVFTLSVVFSGDRCCQYKCVYWYDYTSWHKYISVIIVNNTKFSSSISVPICSIKGFTRESSGCIFLSL